MHNLDKRLDKIKIRWTPFINLALFPGGKGAERTELYHHLHGPAYSAYEPQKSIITVTIEEMKPIDSWHRAELRPLVHCNSPFMNKLYAC